MIKRAKDVTYGETIVTPAPGLMVAKSIASDMYTMTTVIRNGDDKVTFGAYDKVETLDD
ncbi:hypothetical protein SEA_SEBASTISAURUS_22 [Streptomyces phage Sebastisaurus]|uniref:Uncharacterized protein n=1 Tax=Streptomyces phage Sebastisaurus TaxID=2510572 RepID=A0A411B3T5_9CAUD|nr:hypothetical protein SEA_SEBASTISAURUS_22 [Streptomyces phage Sebastisaurus]